VHFGSSVPAGARVFQGVTLDSNLQIVGMTLKLTRERAPLDVDRTLTMERYRDKFQFRGVNDSTIYKTEATRRIADNYATGLLFVADSYRREGQIDSAAAVVNFAVNLRPELLQARAYLAQMAGEYGRSELFDTLIALAPAGMQPDLYFNYGVAAELRGEATEALPAYRAALALDGRHAQAFRRLASGLYDRGSFDSLLVVIDQWITANPDDTTGPLLKADVLSLLRSRGAVPGQSQP
jgi:tetratricopeptide (TPR) repeat protein